MIKTILIIIAVSLLVIFGTYYFLGNNPFTKTVIEMDKIIDSSSSSSSPNNNSEVPQNNNEPFEEVTIKGTLVCLPHKNTDGPQTLECAFGLKNDQNNLYYGLNDPGWKFLIDTPMNTKVTVNGKLRPGNESKYNTVGVIEIINLEK